MADSAEFIKYPPFPPVPPGVTIIPFSKFKESGIRIAALIRPRQSTASSWAPPYSHSIHDENGDDDADVEYIEVDGLGIPTLELLTYHGKDEGKTDAAKKRKINKIRAEVMRKEEDVKAKVKRGMIQRREWWEIWEDGEALRLKQYDPSLARLDRLQLATEDFKSGRQWSNALAVLSNIWSHWRIFTGLSRNYRPGKKLLSDPTVSDPAITNAKLQDELSEDDEMEEDDDFGYMGGTADIPNQDDIGVADVNTSITEGDGSSESSRMIRFLNDMEKATKVFLGPYIRKEGLIWTDRNLNTAPRLLRFYFTYLLRNNVFPEPNHLKGIRASLTLIERAAVELPLFSNVSKNYPDEIGLCGKSCWGEKSESFVKINPDLFKNMNIPAVGGVGGNSERERENENDKVQGGWGAGGGWGEDGKDSNDRDVVIDDATSSSAWGASASGGWGSSGDNTGVINSGDSRDEPVVAKWGTTGDSSSPPAAPAGNGAESGSTPSWDFVSDANDNWTKGGDGAGADDASADAWGNIEVHSFMKLLGGPTVLPLTHTTGVVESSMRRLKKVDLTPTLTPSSSVGKDSRIDIPNPRTVEEDLDQRFAKATFVPWLGWDLKDDTSVSTPRLLETSQGFAIGVPLSERSPPSTTTTKTRGEGTRVHDIYKDEIVVLVEKHVAEMMMTGLEMGYGGTWVQMIRQGGEEEGVVSDESRDEERPVYWYMDQMTHIIPSFYNA